MNWPLIKHLLSMESRRDQALRIAAALEIPTLAVLAWCIALFPGRGKLFVPVHLGATLFCLTTLAQFYLSASIGFFQIAALSQRWLDAGPDSLVLVTGSARRAGFALIVPGFLVAFYRALLLLPLYAVALVCGGLNWASLVCVNVFICSALAASCCLGLLLANAYRHMGKAVGLLFSLVVNVVILYIYLKLSAPLRNRFFTASAGALLLIAMIAFECAARRIARMGAGAFPSVVTSGKGRRRRTPPSKPRDALRTLLEVGLRSETYASVLAVSRAVLCASLVSLAVVPPVASTVARWFVRTRSIRGLRALRDGLILDDLLLTCTDNGVYGRTLFTVLFRRNLIVTPALTLCTTVGGMFLFFVLWCVDVGIFLVPRLVPRLLPRALSSFFTAYSLVALAVALMLTGSAVALAHVFCVTAASCEKQGRWQRGVDLETLSPLKALLATVGGTVLGTFVLLCLRFVVYGTSLTLGVTEVISSHILFCLCLGLPAAFVGASSYHRFVDNFAEWLTTTPKPTYVGMPTSFAGRI